MKTTIIAMVAGGLAAACALSTDPIEGGDDDGDGNGGDQAEPDAGRPDDRPDAGEEPIAGTTLRFTDTTWTCDRPVAEYATDGMPLRVVMSYTHNYDGFGVRLGAGCAGSPDHDPDLILEVEGDGLTHGPQEDAVRVMNELPGARDLEITGRADCGKRENTAIHQDGIQVLGGSNLTWRDFEIGDYQAGRSTCQGAGGAFFYSLESVNTRVIGGHFIACNHSLLAGTAGGEVSGASFRSGRNDGSDPACTYFSSNPCLFESPEVSRGPGVVCERWDPDTASWKPQATGGTQ